MIQREVGSRIQITPEQVQQLLPESHAKGLEASPVVAIQIKGQDRSVLQLWRAAMPWPVYSDNGKELLYWQTEYLLLGYVGGGGMG